MSSGQKTVTVFLTLITGLLLTILGLSRGWPLWLWPPVAALLIAVPLLARHFAGRHRNPFPNELLREPDLPLPPLEKREIRITDVVLPSSYDDYDFRFSATVRWCPHSVPAGAPPVHASGLAVDAVLARARQLTAVRPPTRTSLVQHELDGHLATMDDDLTGRVEAMAVDISLTLSDQDRDRLAKLAAVRKDEAVWEHERRYEQSRRAYLGDDVLANTGSAVVWWLHRNDDKIDRTVQDLGLLAQLTSAVNDTDIDERLRHLVAGPPDDDPDAPGTPDGIRPPDGPPHSPGGFAKVPEEQSAPSPETAFGELLRALNIAPDAPVVPLLAMYVADMAEHADEEFAQALRDRYAAGPPESDGTSERVNGADSPLPF
ncbi:hypothetical protein ACH4SP_40045 [Streptomyces sp. NPDC021093]|uniref:hypothetical protein n=1 Tax=Streptomyces sp. NPDC021093 TaxID=3365112 RepID=UPI0037A098B5